MGVQLPLSLNVREQEGKERRKKETIQGATSRKPLQPRQVSFFFPKID